MPTSAGLLGLGLAGAVATALALSASLGAFVGIPISVEVQVPPPARALLVGCLLCLALVVALAPASVSRRELLVSGLAALGGLAVLVAAPDPFVMAAAVLLLGAGHATRAGERGFAVRLRGPALTALLLGIGWFFVRAGGALGPVGALGLALAVVAGAGVMPYLAEFQRGDATTSSSLVWTAFFGPALALALVPRVLPGMSVPEGTTFAATLIALGLLNLALGAVGAWRTGDDVMAWRYSFLADWGLVLVGMGLLVRDGRQAAYLALLAVVLVRLPLYLRARPALLQGASRQLRPAGLVVALLLAGSAPFSGFPVRLLTLRAATQIWWPLALALVVLMLLSTFSSFRLARNLGLGTGKEAVAFCAVIGLSLALGLLPGLVLALGGY